MTQYLYNPQQRSSHIVDAEGYLACGRPRAKHLEPRNNAYDLCQKCASMVHIPLHQVLLGDRFRFGGKVYTKLGDYCVCVEDAHRNRVALGRDLMVTVLNTDAGNYRVADTEC